MIRSKAITQSAKGESCAVLSPYCNHDRSTVVWAHSNLHIHGKGRGIKAHDLFGCYSCSTCHDWIDRRGSGEGEYRDAYFHRAMAESIMRLIERGIVTIQDCEPEAAASKILPRALC
ncbi:MAG: nuclease domain-containing protein [Gammaproteobacteria bacterium]